MCITHSHTIRSHIIQSHTYLTSLTVIFLMGFLPREAGIWKEGDLHPAFKSWANRKRRRPVPLLSCSQVLFEWLTPAKVQVFSNTGESLTPCYNHLQSQAAPSSTTKKNQGEEAGWLFTSLGISSWPWNSMSRFLASLMFSWHMPCSHYHLLRLGGPFCF